MQNKFKNLRRPQRAAAVGLDIENPRKKFKQVELEASSSSLDEYERHKNSLKKLYESNKWVLPAVVSLLSETYGNIFYIIDSY